MNPNKELWEKGDFSKLAATMRASSDALAERLGVTPGMKVLDLACGDGATALPMALTATVLIVVLALVLDALLVLLGRLTIRGNQ